MLRVLLFVSALCLSAHARTVAPGAGLRSPSRTALLRLSGGAAEPSDALLQATYACNQLSGTTLADAQAEVAALRKSVVGGEAVPTFGAKADEIIGDALDKFDAESPKGDAEVTALYAARGEELRAAITASLEPLFVQQLVLLKDAAMEQFKKQALVGDSDGSEALAAAEAAFVREAGSSVPGKTGWGFKLERQSLVGAMQAILGEQKKAQQAKLQTSQQMQTALSYLQVHATCCRPGTRRAHTRHRQKKRSATSPRLTRAARSRACNPADAAAADAGPPGAVHGRAGQQVEPRRRVPPARHQH